MRRSIAEQNRPHTYTQKRIITEEWPQKSKLMIHTHARRHARTHTCTHVRTHTYIHIHTHTHTVTHIPHPLTHTRTHTHSLTTTHTEQTFRQSGSFGHWATGRKRP